MRFSCLVIIAALLFASCGDGSETGKQTGKSLDDSLQLVDSLDGGYKDFSFVAYNQYLILADADSTWSKTAPSTAVEHDDYYYTIATELRQDKSEKYKSLIGKEYRIYDAAGSSQLVKIQSLKLLAMCGGSLAYYEFPDSIPPTAAQKARMIWGISHFFVAAVFKPVKDKRTYVFGREGTKAEPEFYKKLRDETNDAVVEMLVKTSNYKKAQKKFKALGEYTGNWWEQEDTGNYIENYQAKNGDCYTFATHTAGSICGDESYTNRFSISVTRVGNKPELLKIDSDEYYPVSILDLNNDGTPECILNKFMGIQLVLTRTKRGWVELYRMEEAILECPC